MSKNLIKDSREPLMPSPESSVLDLGGVIDYTEHKVK
jgi:hypothetical protein